MIVEILNDDMPFLVDSVLGELQARGLAVRAIQHPIFKTRRDAAGRLRFTTDVDAVNELFTSGVVTVFGDLFTLVGIMGVMLALDWRLALVTFAVLPFFCFLTDWFRRGARQSFRDTRKWVARINAFLQESLSGMSVVQLYRREARNRAAFAEINRHHYDANMKAIFYYAVFYPMIELLAAVATALILVYGGSRVLTAGLTLGALVAFMGSGAIFLLSLLGFWHAARTPETVEFAPAAKTTA